jgi:hypothetical protein
MEDTSHSLRVFAGSEVTVNLLRSELEQAGISSMVQSDSNTGVSSGFYGNYPSEWELYIQDSDIGKAEPIVNAFLKINK